MVNRIFRNGNFKYNLIHFFFVVKSTDLEKIGLINIIYSVIDLVKIWGEEIISIA